jgi:hypothetical protein
VWVSYPQAYPDTACAVTSFNRRTSFFSCCAGMSSRPSVQASKVMLENLGLIGGVLLIPLGSLLSYLGMQSVAAADATLKVIGGSAMLALGLITVASVLRNKLEFRRHYKRHHTR